MFNQSSSNEYFDRTAIFKRGSRLLNTKYVLTKKFLGEGKFGSVWKGKRLTDGINIAVKIIPVAKLTSKKMKQSLNFEINIQKVLNHPNIMRLYDFEKTKEYVYLFLEFCGQGDLKDFMEQQGGSIDEFYVKKFIKEIALGIRELYRKGIVHRDLKMDNILLTDSMECKIGDFGLARHVSIDNLAQTFCGTPLYMAPEILDHHEYDNTSDLYSLGVLLYEMLYGKYPVMAKSIDELRMKLKSKSIRFPRNENATHDAVNLMRRLMEPDPKKRISFEEFFKHPYISIDKVKEERLPPTAGFVDQEGVMRKYWLNVISKHIIAKKVGNPTPLSPLTPIRTNNLLGPYPTPSPTIISHPTTTGSPILRETRVEGFGLGDIFRIENYVGFQDDDDDPIGEEELATVDQIIIRVRVAQVFDEISRIFLKYRKPKLQNEELIHNKEVVLFFDDDEEEDDLIQKSKSKNENEFKIYSLLFSIMCYEEINYARHVMQKAFKSKRAHLLNEIVTQLWFSYKKNVTDIKKTHFNNNDEQKIIEEGGTILEENERVLDPNVVLYIAAVEMMKEVGFYEYVEQKQDVVVKLFDRAWIIFSYLVERADGVDLTTLQKHMEMIRITKKIIHDL